MQEEIRFDDLSPREIPVAIGDAKYVLREAGEAAAIKHQDAVARAFHMSADGKGAVAGAGLARTRALLVSMCLFGEGGKPVSEQVVQSWPARIVKKLASAAARMSGIGGEETVESLEAKIAELQQQLEELRVSEDAPKN